MRFPYLSAARRSWLGALACAGLLATALLALFLALMLAPGSVFAIKPLILNADAAGNQASRFDVNGNSLDAHDGTLAQFAGEYWWYGTSYGCGYQYQGNSTFCGFKVYSSPDLSHWTDKGFAVPAGDCGYCFRPHVLYNDSTKTYVMWTDGGGAYHVYTSRTPAGPFAQRANPTLAVGGAVDEALFQDDDGSGWLIHNTTQVAAGLTADMVVEKLTPDYLNTTGANVRLGLGDVEGFAVFKRNGVYHALMSDPSCAYCSGGTGEMTATSMLGPWKGAWYDSAGVHQSGRQEPRRRARIVNRDNCGGQPLVVLPVVQEDNTNAYYFISDRWNNRAPNESLANFFIGPLSFNGQGDLDSIRCVDSFTASLKVGNLGVYNASPQSDQGSGYEGFRHHCDIKGGVQRQQTFTPSRTGVLTSASVTTFRSGIPEAPLIVELLNAQGAVLHTATFTAGDIPWAPHIATFNSDVPVTAGQSYALRMRTAATAGCYGFEYNEGNPYAGGAESYSVNGGLAFTAESARDFKFTVDVTPPVALRGPEAASEGPAALRGIAEVSRNGDVYDARGRNRRAAELRRPAFPQGNSKGTWVPPRDESGN